MAGCLFLIALPPPTVYHFQQGDNGDNSRQPTRCARKRDRWGAFAGDNAEGETMIVNSLSFTWAHDVLRDLLKSLWTNPAATLLTTPTLVLFQGPGNPGPNSKVADFAVADFTSYAAQVTGVLTAVANVGAEGLCAYTTKSFALGSADPLVTNVITGYLLTDGTTTYYGGERFAEAVPLASPGDTLTLNFQGA